MDLNTLIKGLTTLTISFHLLTYQTSSATPNKADLIKNLGFLSAQLDTMSQKDGQNNLICPLSIIQILGDLYLISDTPSQEEIRNFIGMPLDFKTINSFAKKLPKNLPFTDNREGNNSYYAGHFIFPSQDLPFNEERLNQLKDLSGEVIITDFENPEEAVHKINQVVDQFTNHKITKMISKEDLNGGKGSLVLLSTLYINVGWQDEFKETKLNFKSPESTKVINGFKGEVEINFRETPEVTTILLPALGDTYLVVRMAQNGSVPPISTQEIQDLLKPGQAQSIVLTMPSFVIENTIDLKQVLINSLPNLLSEKVFKIDLFKESESVIISKFLQKNKLEVSKNGIEGASATEMVIMPRAYVHNQKHKSILIDKPFSFTVIKKVNEQEWVPLFTGQIFEPAL